MGKPLRMVVYGGELRPLVDICRERDVNPNIVRKRMDTGWELEDALTKPSWGDMTWAGYQKTLAKNRTGNNWITEEEEKRIVELSNQFISMRLIKEATGRSLETIQRIRRKHGITTRADHARSK